MILTKEIIKKIENSSPPGAVEILINIFPDEVYFSSSLGQEDQVITDIIFGNDLPVHVFTIDTGRLFNETYELLERTNSKYKKNIGIYFPEADDVEKFVSEKGINSFYESVDNRKECCHIRKVKPLKLALQDAKVWITGLRAEQSVNRKEMKMIEWDDQKKLYKFNPLIHWTYNDVLDYIKEFDVPYNSLHDKGYISIGCAPCTRAISSGEDPRAGRWWWETSQKECGLHQTVLKQEV